MPDIPEGLVPARYIGSGTGLREGMTYYNVDGSKKQDLSLEPGDTMLMQDEDIYGKTLLFDPKGIRQPLYLGIGRVVLPEHKDLSDIERALLGYQHHLGRADFTPIEPLDTILKQREKPAKKGKKPQEVPQTIVVEQAAEESELI